MYGVKGRILVVDLTTATALVLEKDEAFYRKYLGGAFLGARLFEDQIDDKNNLRPFDPANPVVFATGPMAGATLCGTTRVNVVSLSPETGSLYTTQGGGEFGPVMKRAGYDALVIKGQAARPVYLNIDNDRVRFEDAGALWGRDRFATHAFLSDHFGGRPALATIGPAGENRVRHSNIMFEPDHYAGRGGLGAVLGSKNLKAIAIQGDQEILFQDDATVKAINILGAKSYRQAFQKNPDSFLGVLRNYGTLGLLSLNDEAGNLPVKNFACAHLDDDATRKAVSHAVIAEQFVGRRNPCKGCYLGCKKTMRAVTANTVLPEYESMALLGPNLGLTDLAQVMEACDLCNRLGLDTMSTGTLISFLMDCFENEVLDENALGFGIGFGHGNQVLALIRQIAHRDGRPGNLLADGIEATCDALGAEPRRYARFSKGIGLPAHLPRVKPGLGFGYLQGPNPADHMKAEHDWIAESPEDLAALDLKITSGAAELNANKVEIYRATQIFYSAMDSLSLCLFIFGPGNILAHADVVRMVNAATGFDYSFAELMQVGEAAIQLQKKLYVELGGADEALPPFMENEIPDGPTRGRKISRTAFEAARKHYYALWEWDEKGRPSEAVLARLGL
ncbi:MAG: hypothetical protein JJV98_19465 [Desulfosarcina sp.]|nr:hypothetical protein [Desulfobacterales bacterium]